MEENNIFQYMKLIIFYYLIKTKYIYNILENRIVLRNALFTEMSKFVLPVNTTYGCNASVKAKMRNKLTCFVICKYLPKNIIKNAYVH